MSPSEPAHQLTVRHILLGDSSDADGAAALTGSFSRSGLVHSRIKGLRHLSGPAARAVAGQLAETLLASLDLLELRDLLGNGWQKCKELKEAARRTRDLPGSDELVALAPHSITSSHQPSVDLIVKGATVYTCVFDVEVQFDLDGVLAMVRGGELVALRGGRCGATASLGLAGAPLLPQQERRIDLARSIPMKPPVRLLKETAVG